LPLSQEDKEGAFVCGHRAQAILRNRNPEDGNHPLRLPVGWGQIEAAAPLHLVPQRDQEMAAAPVKIFRGPGRAANGNGVTAKDRGMIKLAQKLSSRRVGGEVVGCRAAEHRDEANGMRLAEKVGGTATPAAMPTRMVLPTTPARVPIM
jgi:hypothetical protein